MSLTSLGPQLRVPKKRLNADNNDLQPDKMLVPRDLDLRPMLTIVAWSSHHDDSQWTKKLSSKKINEFKHIHQYFSETPKNDSIFSLLLYRAVIQHWSLCNADAMDRDMCYPFVTNCYYHHWFWMIATATITRTTTTKNNNNNRHHHHKHNHSHHNSNSNKATNKTNSTNSSNDTSNN